VASANEIMRRRAEDTARALLALAPAGSIRAVFVGGSVARDEVTSTRTGDTLVIHSDIDMYVVLDVPAHEAAVRAAAARVVAALPCAQDGVLFSRGVEMGVYAWDDLLAQPVRPGTVDLGEHHVWLHGEHSLIEPIARALARPMQPEEALYLLENRAWDMLSIDAAQEANPENVSAQRALAAKVVMDVGAAHLIAEGRFTAKRADRLARLREHSPALMSPRAGEAIEAAAGLQGGAAPSSLDDGGAIRARVAEAWLALAPQVLRRTSGPRDAATLLAARCSRGAFASNYREAVRMRRRAGLTRLQALASGWHLAGLSPRAALRTYALARALNESGQVPADALDFHSDYVARLTRRLGFRDGSLDERARAAWRAA
jgi:hypothetical protein